MSKYFIFVADGNTTAIETAYTIDELRKKLSDYRECDIQGVIRGGCLFYPTKVNYLED